MSTPHPDQYDPEPGAATESAVARAGPAVVVAVAAAAVTAHGLVEVAAAARVPDVMAWCYPLITDGLALVAYRATSRLTGAGARYAWTVVVIAAGMSGLAQAVYLASESLLTAPAGLRFGVGAWPAVAAAVAAHLVHLLSASNRAAAHVRRGPTVAGAETAARQHDLGIGELPGVVDAVSHDAASNTNPGQLPEAETLADQPTLDERVRALVDDLAAGGDVTGPQAAERFGCSERTARRLLQEARTRLEAVAPRADPGARITTTSLHLVTEGAGSA